MESTTQLRILIDDIGTIRDKGKEVLENGLSKDSSELAAHSYYVNALNKVISKYVNLNLFQDDENDWIKCTGHNAIMPTEHPSMFAKCKNTDEWNDGMFMSISDEVQIVMQNKHTKFTGVSVGHTTDGRWRNELVESGDWEVLFWKPLSTYVPKG